MDIAAKPKPSCFVVMPFGRDVEEQKWFRGWYEVVIAPAIHASGYEPVLSAGEEQPGAINDEIRAHLAFDPMVLVDLGGFEKTDDPNPNVMYELGIRHALGLPLVIMAWEGQHLPFDVSNQRVIMHDRQLLDIEVNKKKIVAFVQAASEGKYYKPMDAVGRMATIAAASEALGKDDILSALVQEVRELKGSVHEAVSAPKPDIKWDSTLPLKTIWNQRKLRKSLFAYFESMGGTAKTWNSVLKHRVSVEFARESATWTDQRWKEYVASEFEPKSKLIAAPMVRVPIPPQIAAPVDDDLIEKVRSCLPEQPWPKDTHKAVIAQLRINGSQYTRAVNVLIKRGVFKRQIDGVLFDTPEEGGPDA